jgi:hypothetical protein
MTFPTTVDFNALINLLITQPLAEQVDTFMSHTEPYALSCHTKKLCLFLFVETAIVFAFLYEARRAKYLA